MDETNSQVYVYILAWVEGGRIAKPSIIGLP